MKCDLLLTFTSVLFTGRRRYAAGPRVFVRQSCATHADYSGCSRPTARGVQIRNAYADDLPLAIGPTQRPLRSLNLGPRTCYSERAVSIGAKHSALPFDVAASSRPAQRFSHETQRYSVRHCDRKGLLFKKAFPF